VSALDQIIAEVRASREQQQERTAQSILRALDDAETDLHYLADSCPDPVRASELRVIAAQVSVLAERVRR
jgi:hypothetical protein